MRERQPADKLLCGSSLVFNRGYLNRTTATLITVVGLIIIINTALITINIPINNMKYESISNEEKSCTGFPQP